MNQMARVAVTLMAAVALLTAQEQQKPETTAGAAVSEAKPLIDAMAAIGSIIAGADQTEEAAPATAEPQALAKSTSAETTLGYEQAASATAAAAASTKDAAAVKKQRSAKNSVILVTSGAAAGAAVGAAMGKGSKGAMIGAAVGGAVGLVYDRMTYKNPGKI